MPLLPSKVVLEEPVADDELPALLDLMNETIGDDADFEELPEDPELETENQAILEEANLQKGMPEDRELETENQAIVEEANLQKGMPQDPELETENQAIVEEANLQKGMPQDPELETENRAIVEEANLQNGLPEDTDPGKKTKQHTGGGSTENVVNSPCSVEGSEEEPSGKESERPQSKLIQSRGSEDSENIATAVQESVTGDGFGLIDSMYYRLFYLRHFRFDDISVRLDENLLLIEAKHGCYTDEHGFATRAFVRKQVLPDDAVPEKLTSYFSGDGVLVVQVPCSKVI